MYMYTYVNHVDTTPQTHTQTLAKGIYDELQSLVEQFGGESIGNIMPLVVNVLENLDSSLSDNQDHLTALDELNEENQQLSKQYQREKQRRKEAEEVCVCVCVCVCVEGVGGANFYVCG